MADLTFAEVLEAAQRLPPEQKAALVQMLHVDTRTNPTREELLTEMETLRASGAFDHVESLADKYANATLTDLSDEELRAAIHEEATEWEKELDELFPDDN